MRVFEENREKSKLRSDLFLNKKTKDFDDVFQHFACDSINLVSNGQEFFYSNLMDLKHLGICPEFFFFFNSGPLHSSIFYHERNLRFSGCL